MEIMSSGFPSDVLQLFPLSLHYLPDGQTAVFAKRLQDTEVFVTMLEFILKNEADLE